MSAGYSLEDSDLIPDLQSMSITKNGDNETYHMLPALHELLVDNLASKVFSRLDVNSLLNNCIRSAAERLARAILPTRVS